MLYSSVPSEPTCLLELLMRIYTCVRNIYGTGYFFHCISIVINCMLCHGYAPTSFLHAAVIYMNMHV